MSIIEGTERQDVDDKSRDVLQPHVKNEVNGVIIHSFLVRHGRYVSHAEPRSL